MIKHDFVMERCLHVFDLCPVKVFHVRPLRSDHQSTRMYTAADSKVSLQRYSCLVTEVPTSQNHRRFRQA